MIDVLVFSKDRAAQLDLLLRSIAGYAPLLYERVTVLWKASEACYADGYEVCMRESAGVVWVREHEFFESPVRHWLTAAGNVVSFLVDDDVFYRAAGWPAEIPWSFRGGDYDYPFSVDGNVYHRGDVIALLDGLRFNDPTMLEHQGHLNADRLPFTTLPHSDRPCLVGVPANRVSASSGMMHMGVHEYDLNERYLGGERLTIKGAFQGINLPAHANLAYTWERRAAAA